MAVKDRTWQRLIAVVEFVVWASVVLLAFLIIIVVGGEG